MNLHVGHSQSRNEVVVYVLFLFNLLGFVDENAMKLNIILSVDFYFHEEMAPKESFSI